MDELSSAEQDMVRLTFLRYNRMKEWYYNQSYNEKYLGIPFAVDGKTETALLKEHYRALYGGKLSDYYITSLFSSVNGMRKSQKELIKLAEQERMQRQENRREKADSLKERLVWMQAGKDWLKAFGRYLAGKGAEPKAPSVQEQGFTYSGGKLFYRGKKNQLMEEDPFVYERELEKRIRQTKARIAQIGDKIRRTDELAGFPPASPLVLRNSIRRKTPFPLQEKIWKHGTRSVTLRETVSSTSPDGLFLQMGITSVNMIQRGTLWK
jgi:hypothetical protein